jgi:lipopolysaccharide biosynthesis regulator YciM
VAALLILCLVLGALAVGVLLGRYYVPDDRALKRRARHGAHYLKALTHHIARDHDTVIDELRRVVDDNVDDSEPYFALAALFRGRGEHERAIRVHQALAVRDGATARLRQRALYELGLDFRAAGMPRRAVKALEQVLADDAGHEGAVRALCGLYEEQGRFAEAAGAWARLGKLRGEPPPRRHHHLLCAAAQQAIAAGDLDSAKQLLKDAKAGGETAHFAACAAELAAARGNPRGARERLCQALVAAPALAPYLVPGLVAAERQLAASGAPALAGGRPADGGCVRRDGPDQRDRDRDRCDVGGDRLASRRWTAGRRRARRRPRRGRSDRARRSGRRRDPGRARDPHRFGPRRAGRGRRRRDPGGARGAPRHHRRR